MMLVRSGSYHITCFLNDSSFKTANSRPRAWQARQGLAAREEGIALPQISPMVGRRGSDAPRLASEMDSRHAETFKLCQPRTVNLSLLP